MTRILASLITHCRMTPMGLTHWLIPRTTPLPVCPATPRTIEESAFRRRSEVVAHLPLPVA